MATQLQLRRGTTSQVAAFTGANGEVVVDTEKKTLFVNDGSTAGGLEIARADFSNISASATLTIGTLNTTNLDLTNLEVTNIKAKDGTSAGSIADSTGVVTIASAVLTTADINAGTFDGVVGGTTPAAGTFTTLGATDLVTFSKAASVQQKLTPGNDSFAAQTEYYNGTSSSGPLTVGQGYASGTDNIGYVWQKANANLLLGTNSTLAITIDTSQNVGIGETVPLGKLHVKTGDSGATADASADELVIEGSAAAGISILTGTSSTASIYLGDSTTNWDGYITYDNGTGRTMTFGTAAGGNYFKIDGTGNFGFATTPTAWDSGYKSIQIGDRGFVAAHTGSDLYVGQNAYIDSGWKYEASVAASLTQHSGGQIGHYVASAGTADAAITWINALNVSPSGGVTVNSSQNSNINFIAKSGSDGNALVLDGSSGALGLGAAPAYARLDVRQYGTGAQDRGLYVEVSPSSSGSNLNAALINAGNANMTGTVVRIHHESPAANQKLLSLDTTGSNTEKFYVDEDGDTYVAGHLLVGTTSPSYTHNKGIRLETGEVGNHILDAALSMQGSGGDFYAQNWTGPSNVGFGTLAVFSGTTDYLTYRYMSGGTISYDRFTIYDTGDLSCAGELSENTSDERLKSNITLISDPIEKIKSIRGVEFDWKETTPDSVGIAVPHAGKHEVGVIAQEVQKILPDAVSHAPFDNDKGESVTGENYLTVKYTKLIPILIEGMKEQQTQIEALKSEVAALKGE